MNFLDRIADQLNLRWAWEKVRNSSIPGDIWIDEVDLAQFELNLERNLSSIGRSMASGKYKLAPIRPMAFPKAPKADGSAQVRQYFHFRVADQVAWVAVTNVLAQYVDNRMPTWSYGNRLFRSIWIDTADDGTKRRRIGRYRHSSGRIYLPFQQGWPVFRRHVYLTIRAMSATDKRRDPVELSEEDQDELTSQHSLADEYRCPFVFPEYWTPPPGGEPRKLYWCSMDFSKFYPSMKLENVRRSIVALLPDDHQKDASILLETMLHFRLDTSGWNKQDLKKIGLRPNQRRFPCIPTGLHVAGFLANAGLMQVDNRIADKLRARPHHIAHFRYVDDHIFLSYDFNELIAWMDDYVAMLKTFDTGATVNPDKSEPPELATYLKSRHRTKSSKRLDSLRRSAIDATSLDPDFPSPLMTKTLALVSRIGRTDFSLLEEAELSALVNQLEHFLLVDIPDTELPERTRLAFAATRLARLAEQRLANDADILHLEAQIRHMKANEESPASIASAETSLLVELGKLTRESRRVFSLLRKVLRDRPDRVRLWTRAIQLCRQIGVAGLRDIYADIHELRIEKDNALAADYLLASTLALVGANAIVASRLMVDPEVAEWRRRASATFLQDAIDSRIDVDSVGPSSWIVAESWRLYCFGIYCAHLIAHEHRSYVDTFPNIPDDLLKVGRNALALISDPQRQSGLAWWAARPTLSDLSTKPETWVLDLGEMLEPSQSSLAYWRFFPEDAPFKSLEHALQDKQKWTRIFEHERRLG